jgi:hypothetical protein
MKQIAGSNVKYKPISLDDYEQFYGDSPLPKSIRGVSFFLDDSIAGVAGIKYDGYYFTVFSDMKDGIIVPPITVWRATKIVMDMVNNLKCDVYAIKNPDIEGACAFLNRLGFVDIGGIYKRSTT